MRPLAFEAPKGLNVVNTRALTSIEYLEGMKRFSWSPDGEALAIPRHDGKIEIWDIKRDKAQILAGHNTLVSSVAWHPAGRILASGSDDHTLKVWNLDGDDGQCTTLPGHSDNVTSVAWSSRGELASSSDDGTVRIWRLKQSWSSETLLSHSDRVLDVAWSPDGKILTSASWDQQIGFWESAAGVRKKPGHTARIFCVRWCPTMPGSVIASGDQDGYVLLWDASGRELNRFRAHNSAVLSVSFSPDGQYLVSRDKDVAKIWRIFEPRAVPHDMLYFVCRGTPPYATIVFDPVSSPNRIAVSMGESDEQLVVFEADYRAMVNRRVFIVHGRDDEALQAVKATLLENGLEPVSLREQPDTKLSFVMEKFELYSDVGFAIVLLTPDDIGSLADSTSHSGQPTSRARTDAQLAGASRARQNVILELGYFIGRLGYEKVCLLQKGSVEFPSDLSGVLFIDMDANGAWRPTLKERLQRSGLALTKIN